MRAVAPSSSAAHRPFIIGISGGSGSGKTTLARMIHQRLTSQHCEILYQDSYYLGQSENFDHPDSLDFGLMSEHLRELSEGRSVNVPTYDFVSHSRRPETVYFQPKSVVVVDGILILTQKAIRRHLDYSVFVETSEELRFARRLERDIRERGRTEEGVIRQFFSQVKPMHDLFVEPSKQHADLSVCGEGRLEAVLEKIIGIEFESHKNLVLK